MKKWYELFDDDKHNLSPSLLHSMGNFILAITFWGGMLFLVIMALIYFWYVLIPLGIILWLIDYKRK